MIYCINYPIYIGNNVFEKINSFLKRHAGTQNKIFILADENTMQHCLPLLVNHVPILQNAEIIEIDSGEENKNIDICINIWHELIANKADKQTVFINLGGGVISDLGGFIASTFKRGIKHINIPTTLMAQVDAAIGSKTSVDLDHVKNAIGVFKDPAAVFIIPEFLTTLPERQLLSGFSEMIKHGLIYDNEYWNELIKIENLNEMNWLSHIHQSVLIKKEIVTFDPKEKGFRKILNFGHTIGHALEGYYNKKKKNSLLHGEAIAAGMICESCLSHLQYNLHHDQLNQIVDYILKTFNCQPIEEKSIPEIIEMMKNDKKNKHEKINFTLIPKIGEARINNYCTIEEIKASFDFYNKEITSRKK